MTFSIIHCNGSSENTQDLDSLNALFDELSTADQEHGDVALVHEETGWSLSAHRDGRAVFENLDSGGERHMIPVPKDHVIRLWHLLAAGQIDEIFREPWKLGYGT